MIEGIQNLTYISLFYDIKDQPRSTCSGLIESPGSEDGEEPIFLK